MFQSESTCTMTNLLTRIFKAVNHDARVIFILFTCKIRMSEVPEWLMKYVYVIILFFSFVSFIESLNWSLLRVLKTNKISSYQSQRGGANKRNLYDTLEIIAKAK